MTAIAVDVMSGDAGVRPPVIAAQTIKAKTPESDIILVGDKAEIERALGGAQDDFEIITAPEVVAMDEPPARAIRRRDTSMRRALELVADGRAHAAVSAGNTGALMGLGMLVLRPIDGITRPAIGSFMPTRNANDSCCMLDLGANSECSAEMLRDFALMGAAMSQAVKNIPHPRVGLLNIGEEDFKGSKLLLEAAELLAALPALNFVGNVEGDAIFRGEVDVVVCDGFTGNVALKVTEGLAQMIGGMLRNAFREDELARVCSVLALPVLRRLRRRLDHRPYNGACFLGLRGVLVKSHGNADEVAFAAAIQCAVDAAAHNLPDIIARASAAEQRQTLPGV